MEKSKDDSPAELRKQRWEASVTKNAARAFGALNDSGEHTAQRSSINAGRGGTLCNPSTQKDERRELQVPDQTALYQVKICFTVLSHRGDEMIMLCQFLPT